MDGRELPGFYYDKEKKKYFKIQDARHAPPAGSKYTTENVRREQNVERLEKRASALLAKQKQQTIVRRHAKRATYAVLDREYGMHSGSHHIRTARPNIFAATLQPWQSMVVLRQGKNTVRLFDRDPVSQDIYAVLGDNTIKRRSRDPDALILSSEEHDYSWAPWDFWARLSSTISSLTFLPNSGALAATTLGSDRAPVVYLSDPHRDGPIVNQQFTPKSTATIWAAAARPSTYARFRAFLPSVPATDVEQLAVGTSRALLMFTRTHSGNWDSATVIESNSDMLSVEWLSSTIVAAGCRNGHIQLYDTRSRGHSHLLTHPHPVTRLKRADDPTRLICSGVPDPLVLYDIRMSRPARNKPMAHLHGPAHKQQIGNDRKFGTPAHKKRWKSKGSVEASSLPVISFQHKNADHFSPAIDVDPQLGLLAASQDRHIRIYNIWTGAVVRDLEAKDVECLRFVEQGAGDSALWATSEGSIVRFMT